MRRGSRKTGVRKLCNLEKWIWAGNYKQLQLILLTSIKKMNKDCRCGETKNWPYWRKHQRQKAGFSLQYSCRFSKTKKHPGAPENSQTNNDCCRLLCALWGLIPAASAICRGQTRSLPECYSIRARRV